MILLIDSVINVIPFLWQHFRSMLVNSSWASPKQSRKYTFLGVLEDQCIRTIYGLFLFLAGDKSFSLVVRQCVTDNGDVNEETEIGRSNHCGLVNMLEYNGNIMQHDACNDTRRPLASGMYASFLTTVVAFLTSIDFLWNASWRGRKKTRQT